MGKAEMPFKTIEKNAILFVDSCNKFFLDFRLQHTKIDFVFGWKLNRETEEEVVQWNRIAAWKHWKKERKTRSFLIKSHPDFYFP